MSRIPVSITRSPIGDAIDVRKFSEPDSNLIKIGAAAVDVDAAPGPAPTWPFPLNLPKSGQFKFIIKIDRLFNQI